MRTVAIGLLALISAQGCAAHKRPVMGSARYPAAAQAMGATVEASDPKLSAALLALTMSPTATGHRAAADEYLRLGIRDTAFDHLTAAIRLDPRDAAAYDAKARIWRDWGFPRLGMADAARAVFYAPHSAAAHNTWGTLLAAAGEQVEARRQFEQALALDPGATFAVANLCYLDMVASGVTSAGTCPPVSVADSARQSSK